MVNMETKRITGWQDLNPPTTVTLPAIDTTYPAETIELPAGRPIVDKIRERTDYRIRRELADLCDSPTVKFQQIASAGRVHLVFYVPANAPDPVLPIPIDLEYNRRERFIYKTLFSFFQHNMTMGIGGEDKWVRRQAKWLLEFMYPKLLPFEFDFYKTNINMALTDPQRLDLQLWRRKTDEGGY